MVFDGQSGNNVPDTAPMPSLAMAAIGLPHAVVAINGQSWTDLATTATTRRDRVLNQANHTILVLAGGFQDLVGEHDSAATALADMVAYAASARAAHRGAELQIVGCTITPSTACTGSDETNRVALNASILASGAWEGHVDLATLPQLDDPTDATYYSDGTHWTAAGATAAAAALAPAIAALL